MGTGLAVTQIDICPLQGQAARRQVATRRVQSSGGSDTESTATIGERLQSAVLVQACGQGATAGNTGGING